MSVNTMCPYIISRRGRCAKYPRKCDDPSISGKLFCDKHNTMMHENHLYKISAWKEYNHSICDDETIDLLWKFVIATNTATGVCDDETMNLLRIKIV